MFGRWIILLLLVAAPCAGITRPDTKKTLRQLTRLPRVEMRFSLDFDAAQGFPALNAAVDPVVAIGQKRVEVSEKPGDPAPLLELGRLHMATGEFGTANTYFRRAEEAFRRRLESAAGNAELRAGLASALHGLARQPEAESVFRETIAGSSDAKAWLAFAVFLEARGWEIASGAANWNGRRSYADLCRGALRQNASSENVARAARYLDEAVASARRAVELKADLAAAHHRLAVCVASRECFERVRKRLASDEQNVPVEMLIYSAAAIEHLEKAVELDNGNPLRIGTLALWRTLAAAARSRATMREFMDDRAIEFLPESERSKVEEAIGRLAEINDAAAGQAQGTLLLILKGDAKRAAEALQRALERNADSEQLWETLCIALNRAENYFELAAVAEARGIDRPTVRNRVLIAKAYEKLGNFDRAEEEVRLALAINAGDFSANIALANLLMRNAENEALLPRVRQSISTAERALTINARSSQWVDLALTQSIYHGLSDNPDAARQILNAALVVNKDDAEVNAALDAIGR